MMNNGVPFPASSAPPPHPDAVFLQYMTWVMNSREKDKRTLAVHGRELCLGIVQADYNEHGRITDAATRD